MTLEKSFPRETRNLGPTSGPQEKDDGKDLFPSRTQEQSTLKECSK